MSHVYEKTPKSKTKDSQKKSIKKKTKKQGHPLVDLSETIGNKAMQRLTKKRVLQKKNIENKTGLPDNIKTGIEHISGISLGDVKVNYNSSKPSKVDALAYTQGNDIHVGPGQKKHLAHEAWHVVQQKQGRVKPNIQTKYGAINVDKDLELEADTMGAKVSAMNSTTTQKKRSKETHEIKDTKQFFLMPMS